MFLFTRAPKTARCTPLYLHGIDQSLCRGIRQRRPVPDMPSISPRKHQWRSGHDFGINQHGDTNLKEGMCVGPLRSDGESQEPFGIEPQ
jgi:hypothetical protein